MSSHTSFSVSATCHTVFGIDIVEPRERHEHRPKCHKQELKRRRILEGIEEGRSSQGDTRLQGPGPGGEVVRKPGAQTSRAIAIKTQRTEYEESHRERRA